MGKLTKTEIIFSVISLACLGGWLLFKGESVDAYFQSTEKEAEKHFGDFTERYFLWIFFGVPILAFASAYIRGLSIKSTESGAGEYKKEADRLQNEYEESARSQGERISELVKLNKSRSLREEEEIKRLEDLLTSKRRERESLLQEAKGKREEKELLKSFMEDDFD